jgi:hypothetical protein
MNSSDSHCRTYTGPRLTDPTVVCCTEEDCAPGHPGETNQPELQSYASRPPALPRLATRRSLTSALRVEPERRSQPQECVIPVNA